MRIASSDHALSALEAERKAQQLSSREVGRRAGLSVNAYRRAARERGGVRLSTVLAAAEALGLELRLVAPE